VGKPVARRPDGVHNQSMPLAAISLALAVLLAPPAAAQRERPSDPAIDAAAILPGARTLPPSFLASLREPAESLRLALPDPAGATVELVLVPASPFAPNARIEVAGRRRGLPPRTIAASDLGLRAWRGRVTGEPDSSAYLLLSEHSGGTVFGGLVRIAPGSPEARTLYLSAGPYGAGLDPTVWEPALAGPLAPGDWSCVALEPPGGAWVPEGGIAGYGGGDGTPCRELDVAIETDLEFSANLFGGNLHAAAAYATLLMGATGEIFTNDVHARLRVSYLRLWETDDPWNQTGTANQLFQFRDHWVAQMGSVVRDEAHFLSGRGLGGGVAWLPGLCGDYSYALSANLGGSFPYPLVSQSGANWDIMVVAHEAGHNFGAPHTHNTSPPVDGCGNNDCSQASSGTIMSYCHLCAGGLANIHLNFHPVNAQQMKSLLAGVPCDYSDLGGAAHAVDDFLGGPEGSPLAIDPLANDADANCSPVSLVSFDVVTSRGGIVTKDGPLLRIQPAPGVSGRDHFTYRISDANGSTGVGQVFLDLVPVLPSTPVTGTSPGLDVAWYALAPGTAWLPDFATLAPYANSAVPNLNIASTGGNFSNSGRADHVAGLFTGWLEVPAGGLWTISSESDDGSRVLVNGVSVVENDGLHPMVDRSGTIGLAAGKHALRVEFFENEGGAGLIVRIAGPGTARQAIPAAWLSRGGSVPAGPDFDGDGVVGPADLAMLLAGWGTANPALDLSGNGSVGAEDLAIVLGHWTQP